MVHAVDLTWDANGSGAPTAADGSGNWDLSSDNWFDGTNNVIWANGSNAQFGNLSSSYSSAAPQNNVNITAPITVGNLVVGTAADGGGYNFGDAGGSLTLNGNMTKASGGGVVSFLLVGSPLTLGAGNHTFIIRDTPGDAAEITINGVVAGAGNVVVDNQFFESWGTLGFTFANTYTGTTSIQKGRLVITDSQGLGATSAGTTISNSGTLGLGGGGLTANGGGITVNEPITITRSDYSSGPDFTTFGAAIFNDAGNNTLSGPITINTPDARFRIDGGNSNLTITTDLVTSGKISISGGGPGSIELTGNNTGVAGGFNIRGGSLTASNQNNLGGASSILTFGNEAAAPGGGGYLKIMNDFMTDFGTHAVNFGNFSGGIDVQGTVFNITQDIGTEAAPAGQLNKRGPGALNLSGTNWMNGRQFIDLGTVNIKAGTSTVTGGVGLRNGVLNIEAGATYNTRNNYISIGIDSGENSTVNVFGNFIVGNADFNVSDLANTTGTLNIHAGALVQTDGINFISKNNGSLATINQDGGKYHVRRTGDFGLVLGSRRGTGIYNMSGGELQVDGEFYVGQGNGGSTDAQGVGVFDMSGGTAVANRTVTVGREGAGGTMTIRNGAVFTKQGDQNFVIDQGQITNVGETPSVLTVDNATLNLITGELRVGNTAGTNGTLNVRNGATVTINNWLGVGRDNGKGALNMEGGTFTKQGANNISIAWQPNSDGRIVQTGGTFNVTTGETWISEGGVGLIDVSGGAMNTGRLDVGRSGAKTGTLNISGTAAVTATNLVIGNADSVAGTVNLSGGSLKVASVAPGTSTGTKEFNFTGGTLSANAFTLATPLANNGTGKLAPGGVGTAAATTIGAGGYTQGANASMALDLGGPAAGAFDSIASSGPVTLAGKLDLALLNSYAPTLLTPHVVLTSSALTGKFGTVSGVVYTPGRGLAVTYSETNVTVTPARLGDANLDGSVNFDDLLVLSQNYSLSGTSWATGDFDGTGTTVFDDLLALSQNYGQSGLGLPTDLGGNVSAAFAADWALALSMVPEPSSMALLGLAGAALSRSRRR